MDTVKNVVIVGGGTAGWMTAAAISKLLGNNLNVKLIESDSIGSIGVGESTIPTLITLHKLLKIKEQDFVAAVNATFKLGISFENWQNIDAKYFHSFGWTGKDCWAGGFQHFWLKGKDLGISSAYADYCLELAAALQNKFAILQNNALNYAYHIDSGLYAKFLRTIAEANNCQRIEGKITKVNQNPESGYITSVQLENNDIIAGDLFVDCSGFRSLLARQQLQIEFENWQHWLPCDRAIAVQTQALAEPIAYTKAIAHSGGWQWRIPLQSRVGNGIVYSSAYMDAATAESHLLNNITGKTLITPNKISFKTGQLKQYWHKNCVAIGLSSAFIEPLESTSIHLMQRGIIRLLQSFPHRGIRQSEVAEYNKQMRDECEHIRDFIILHYTVTNRTDSDFWRYCATMQLPASLQHRIEMFQATGRVFQSVADLFTENSWVQVMLGQGIYPEQYHIIADTMSKSELNNFLTNIKLRVQNTVNTLPNHHEFIKFFLKN